jgi:HlyD family type I secretion membrane fusion protein
VTASALPKRGFASLLEHDTVDAIELARTRVEWRRMLRHGLVPLLIIGGAIVAWAATAPLAGAVIAPAHAKVELNRKTVQHQEGGIVREILVREGQPVKAGEPLVVVGDLRSSAELALQRDALRDALARRARGAAESALESALTTPAELAGDAEAAEHLRRERDLFATRRRALDEQVASLHDQLRHAHAQATALQARAEAADESARYASEETEINEQLVQQGFVNRTRLLGLQRGVADSRARSAEFRGELAAVRQRIGELGARIAALRSEYRAQGALELKEAAARVHEAEQRLRPSNDQVERQIVRSPVDGTVMAVRVSSAGEAIGPRQPILEIVPVNEKLVFEARVRTEDIERVRKDSTAEVHLAGGDAVLPLPGRVVFVSPDRVNSTDGRETWFVVTVEVDAKTLQAQPQLRLQAGMPAEVFVTTAERTLLEYLAKPLEVFASRAMREP